MYPSFQNSPIRFGGYPKPSHRSQHSQHSFTFQAESSHRFHQPSPDESFNLPQHTCNPPSHNHRNKHSGLDHQYSQRHRLVMMQ